MHPQILALGLKLPLTLFVCDVPSHLRIAPSQLSKVASVLGFEALCALSVPDACQREVFCAANALRKTPQDAHFVPQSGCEKLIVNMVDNRHGICDAMV